MGKLLDWTDFPDHGSSPAQQNDSLEAQCCISQLSAHFGVSGFCFRSARRGVSRSHKFLCPAKGLKFGAWSSETSEQFTVPKQPVKLLTFLSCRSRTGKFWLFSWYPELVGPTVTTFGPEHFWPAPLLAHTTFVDHGPKPWRTILDPQKPWSTGLLFGTICCSCLVFWAMDLHCVVFCCGVVWCVGAVCVQDIRGVRPRFGRSSRLPLSGLPLRRTPKISLVFPSPATIFSLSFFPLLGGPFVEFWWCWKRRGPEMCTFGVLQAVV